MGPVVKFRGFAIRVVGILTIISLIVIVAAMIPHPRRLLQLGPALLTASFIAYAIMWRPYVELSDAGVLMRNVLQVVHIPWPAMKSISARWSLTIITAQGEHSAWALPATPTGAAPRFARGEVNRSDALAVGRLIEERYQAFYDAGHLTSPAARRLEASATYDWPTIIIIAAGTLVSVLALIVG